MKMNWTKRYEFSENLDLWSQLDMNSEDLNVFIRVRQGFNPSQILRFRHLPYSLSPFHFKEIINSYKVHKSTKFAFSVAQIEIKMNIWLDLAMGSTSI